MQTDAEDRREREALRERGAVFDRVTGLYDLPAHFDRLRSLYEEQRSLGLFHIDLSRTTNLEAIYGWQFYDALLERFARRLEVLRGSLISEHSIVALDGVHSDKFLLFIAETMGGQSVHAEALHEIAEVLRPYLRAHLAEERLAVGQACEPALGYALVSGTPFWRFERLVYQGVEEARRMSARQDEARRARDGVELRRILSEESIDILFQPVVELADGRIIGYEALSRGPRRTAMEAPAVLFSLSSELGIERDLDRLCQAKAMKRAGGLRAEDLLFLNSLPATLADPAWQILPQGRGRAAGTVVLEINERGMHADADELLAALGRLREQGFRVAIDDIGTGYASFPLISRLKPDYTKLDVSLVRGIDRNLIQQEVLRSLVELCAKVEATVIAEGIETAEELEVLRAQGVRLGQGFYFSHPASALPVLAGPRVEEG
jgi:EAL domain-containing protein (putative c-di-GMP-specific phosphodiesterase class I)